MALRGRRPYVYKTRSDKGRKRSTVKKIDKEFRHSKAYQEGRKSGR